VTTSQNAKYFLFLYQSNCNRWEKTNSLEQPITLEFIILPHQPEASQKVYTGRWRKGNHEATTTEISKEENLYNLRIIRKPPSKVEQLQEIHAERLKKSQGRK
jgi:hypothetical protein